MESFMPLPSKIGWPRKWQMREVWDAIKYIAAAGCQSAMRPKFFRLSRRSSAISTTYTIVVCSTSSTKF